MLSGLYLKICGDNSVPEAVVGIVYVIASIHVLTSTSMEMAVPLIHSAEKIWINVCAGAMLARSHSTELWLDNHKRGHLRSPLLCTEPLPW